MVEQARATQTQQQIATELGPCFVTVQHGPENRLPVPVAADVYLHGAAGSWATFRPLLSGTPLRDRVLIDLPGWGASTQDSRMGHFSIEAASRSVVAVLESLGYARWNLVGHSMGGFLALHIASELPQRTASVATISATTFTAAEAVRTPMRSLFTVPAFVGMLTMMRCMASLGSAGSALIRAVGSTPLMGLLMSPFFASPEAVPAAVIRGLSQDARPASFSLAARAAASYDFDQWRGIRCPVLALRGDRDVFTPASDLAMLADLVPHLQAVTLQRCGHFAHVEQPENVLHLLATVQRW